MNMITFTRRGMLAAFLFLFASQCIAQVQLGLPINLPNSVEKSPTLSPDGKHIVYISNENGGWQMFDAYLKPDGSWDDPMPLDSVNKYVTVPVKLDHPCFSGDGQRIYFAADYPGGKGGLDIYYSDLINGKWSKPSSVGEPVNTIANEDMPSLTSDGQGMYLTRPNFEKRDEMNRCEQIWYAERSASGGWKNPKLLPELINSGCESSPRIFPDGKLLLFSSTREDKKQANPLLKPKQGFDIYASRLLTRNVWSAPMLMYTLNTDGDDYSPSLSGSSIYYSSIKEQKGAVLGGIFIAKVPDSLSIGRMAVVSGVLSDAETGKPLAGSVKVLDQQTLREVCVNQTSSADGSFYISLLPGSSYILDFTSPNYSHWLKTCDYSSPNAALQEKIEVKLGRFVKFKMKVFDSETFKPIVPHVDVSPQVPASNLRFVQDGQGVMQFALAMNKKYVLKIDAPNYQTLSLPIDLTYDAQQLELELDAPLVPARDKFELNIVDQNGQVYDAEVEAVKLMSSEILNSAADDNAGRLKKVSTGKFELQLHLGQRYWIQAIANKKTLAAGELFDVTEQLDRKLVVRATEIKAGSTILQRGIKFMLGSAEIEPSSEACLLDIYQSLLDNPNLKFEVNAYCNDKTADEIVNKLTYKRAQAVVEYLVGRGVKSNRLSAKGNGKNNPIAPNDSDVNRLKNERIELKIIE